MRENTEGQINGGEKQSRVKFSAAKEREAAGWVSRLVPAGSGKAELKQARDDSSYEGEGIN